MHQLRPEPGDEVDLLARYAADPRPAPADRPWVLLNMIASADGASATEGLSGGLGGPADKAVFRAVRGLPDVILVGAETVRAERYGPPRPPPEVRRARLDRGQAASARLAVVSRHLRFEPDARLFREADPAARPMILTTDDAPADRIEALSPVADIVRCGSGHVDLAAALRQLRHDGLARIVLAEGGPTLNATLVAEQLIDELCLTIAPLLVGGDAARICSGDIVHEPHQLRLTRVLEEDGYLFLRYVRERTN